MWVEIKMTNRKEPSRKTTGLIFADTGGICCICQKDIRHKNGVSADRAHIYGLNLGSARFDPNLSYKFLNSAENLLVICNDCHDLIDNIAPNEYTAERLLDYKYNHIVNGILEKWREYLRNFYDSLDAISYDYITNTAEASGWLKKEMSIRVNQSNHLPPLFLEKLKKDMEGLMKNTIEDIDLYIFSDDEGE